MARKYPAVVGAVFITSAFRGRPMWVYSERGRDEYCPYNGGMLQRSELHLRSSDHQIIYELANKAQACYDGGKISMDTFLPAMKGATAPLLTQAVHEMEQHYTRYQFGRHLARFRRILQRSTMVSEEDKQKVEEELRMEYDSLIDENPEVKERVAKGKAEGEIQGELRELLINFAA